MSAFALVLSAVHLSERPKSFFESVATSGLGGFGCFVVSLKMRF